MRLLSVEECAIKTDVELAILFGMVANDLGRAAPGSLARTRAITSLRNINRARSARHYKTKAPGR